MSNIPNYSVNSDKRVKLLQNGTPVSNSTAASQYARPLNLIGSGVSATSNDTLGTFDVSIPGSTNNTMANVGTGAGQVYRDTTSNTYNLKTISAGANVTITNNANDVNVAVNSFPYSSLTGVPATSGINPYNGAKKTGQLLGGLAAVGTGKVGSGFMANWQLTANTINSNADADGSYIDLVTSTTSGNPVYYKGDFGTSYLNPAHNPTFYLKIKIPVITSTRMYFGFYDTDAGGSNTTAPLPTNAINYLNSHKGFGIMYDSSLTTWQIEWNNGLATNSTFDTGVTVTANTAYTFLITYDNTAAKWGVSVNGATIINPATTNIPQTSAYTYGFTMQFQTMTSSTRDIFVYYLHGETDR